MISYQIKRKISLILPVVVMLLALPTLLLAQTKTTAVLISDSLDGKNTIELKTVNIYNKKPKIKKLGTDSFTPMVWTSKTNTIHELARLITINMPTKLLSVNVLCGGKKSGDSVTYRLNIYHMKEGYPDTRLVEKVFIKKFSTTSKKLSFDLGQEDIILTEDFVVSFEYVPEQEPDKYPLISFRAKLNAKDSYRKETKEGQWRKTEGGCAAIYAEVEQ